MCKRAGCLCADGQSRTDCQFAAETARMMKVCVCVCARECQAAEWRKGLKAISCHAAAALSLVTLHPAAFVRSACETFPGLKGLRTAAKPQPRAGQPARQKRKILVAPKIF